MCVRIGGVALLVAVAFACHHDGSPREDSGVVDSSLDSGGSTVPLSAIGVACDDTHPCHGNAVCGTCGIGTGQCIALCSANGSGAAVGCPEGTYCSNAWFNTSVHICVRVCVDDSTCRQATGNAGLSCNDPYTDNGDVPNDTSICNVSNSIGSTHTCM